MLRSSSAEGSDNLLADLYDTRNRVTGEAMILMAMAVSCKVARAWQPVKRAKMAVLLIQIPMRLNSEIQKTIKDDMIVLMETEKQC